ncbi:MAG: TetR/AcrR family transcriptional regulator [Firmicutes bacterium]|nr:TetR/AcrR family transcriptional regulator [Bacillota bacterium]
MSKITNRAKQAEATKNKIYECGVKLIRKHGFDQVTVEQISKGAGVSVGTYYYYFQSKFDLFSEIFKRADEYFQNHVANNLTAEDPVDQIVEFFDKYADFNILDGIEMVKKLYTADNKMFITKGRAMQIILNSIIEKGQANNQITKSLSSQEITTALFVTARGVIYEWCLYDGKLDLKQEMKKLITIMVNGLTYTA